MFYVYDVMFVTNERKPEGYYRAVVTLEDHAGRVSALWAALISVLVDDADWAVGGSLQAGLYVAQIQISATNLPTGSNYSNCQRENEC